MKLMTIFLLSVFTVNSYAVFGQQVQVQMPSNFPAGNSGSNYSKVINDLYKLCLGRDAEQPALNIWIEQMRSGYSFGSLKEDICRGPENRYYFSENFKNYMHRPATDSELTHVLEIVYNEGRAKAEEYLRHLANPHPQQQQQQQVATTAPATPAPTTASNPNNNFPQPSGPVLAPIKAGALVDALTGVESQPENVPFIGQQENPSSKGINPACAAAICGPNVPADACRVCATN